MLDNLLITWANFHLLLVESHLNVFIEIDSAKVLAGSFCKKNVLVAISN